jgi:hypothetical protein
MMDSPDDVPDQVREFWQNNQPLEAGRLIFERIPNELRPKWAAGILRSVVEHTTVKSPLIDLAVQIGTNPEDWRHGHAASTEIGRLLLTLEQNNKEPDQNRLLIHVLWLGVIVCRLSYNATSPTDPYDDDTGYHVASILKSIVDLIGDNGFSQTMWKRLCQGQP